MLPRLRLFVSAVLVCQVHATTYTTRQIFQFPSSKFTSIENVAIRPSGELLLTTSSAPDLYLLNPADGKPSAKLVHTFTGANSSETLPDLYAVACGITSKETFTGTLGSFAVWSVDLRCSPPEVKKITAIPEAKFLNGLTRLQNNANIVLVAESELGVVYSLDMRSGKYRTAIKSQYFEPTAMIPIGINGIRTFGQRLYFTNSAKGIFASVPVTHTGESAGRVDVIAQSGPTTTFDDFAIDSRGDAWLVDHPQSVLQITASGHQTTIANTTRIVQPSSAIFGRGGKTLYVVTAGFVSGNNTQGGQVFEVVETKA